jgi:hypothetical protein
VAYTSDQSGRPEIYVHDIVKGTRKQVSHNGGGMPVWSRDGRELFHHTLQGNRWIAVQVKAGSSIQLEQARTLFALTKWMRMSLGAQYDVSPDGQRFLVNLLVDNPGQLTLMENWAP